MKHLVDLLRYQAKQIPHKLAYTFLKEGYDEEGALSFSDLDHKARQGAVFIQQYVPAGGRVLLLYPPGVDFIVGFFACLYAGVIAIPAPPPDAARLKRTLPRLKSIVKDAEASLVLSSQQLLGSLDQHALHDFPVQHWHAYESLQNASAGHWEMPEIQADSIAYLQYTSGSTSTPKGVMMSHANLMHHLALIKEAWAYDEESVSVTWMPYFHDYGLVDGLLEPLYNGASCYILSPVTFLKRPIRWLEAISNYRGTHTQAPNFAYSYCLEKISDEQKQGLDLSSLKVASNGAEPVRADTVRDFCQAFACCGFRAESLYPAYGLAEATLLVATKSHGTTALSTQLSAEQQQLNNIQGKVVSCGPAIGTMDIKIINPVSLQPCLAEDIGEVWIHDKSVAQGYWRNEQATDATFKARIEGSDKTYMRSGDLGFIKNDELYITGRLKDLVIIDGVNHYPQDIEWTVINAHHYLRPEHAAAFSIELDAQEHLVIAVELAQKTAAYEDIVHAIRQALSTVHEIDVYAIVLLKKGTILKTSSGKLQRSACQKAFLNSSLVSHFSWQKTPLKTVKTKQEKKALNDFLVSALANCLSISETQINRQEPFASYGLSSRLAVSLVADIEDFLGLDDSLSPTLFWQYNTLDKLLTYLNGTEQNIELAQTQVQEAIAIIGVGCRFPKANSPEQFWALLSEGRHAITEIPTTRFKVPYLNKAYAGLLDNVDQFDADFFRLSAKEAHAIDPQQRILMEVVWEALEQANIIPDHLAGTETGVFVGISTDDYAAWQLNQLDDISEYAGTGKTFSIAANRLSYFLDLKGPSLAIDTACSSSLVAVHQACQSLRNKESTLAIAAGVNLILSPQLMTALAKAQMLSPDGLCKTFSDEANGYVRGEGVGAVILKRLSEAEQEGDTILAVIRGSAINQDGRSNGLTAPDMQAQQQVIGRALEAAQVKPEDIAYVEAHGTGTALGDPIEMDALQTVFKDNKAITVGSVKTNIGHLEAAAGMAGLIKVVLSLQHHTIPKHLHLKRLNPLIKFANTGFSIANENQTWQADRLMAGISSFGFGGTNAHLIISGVQQKEISVTNDSMQAQLFVLSAQSPEALLALKQQYEAYLDKYPDSSVQQLAYSVFHARSHFTYRFAMLANSLESLQSQLKSLFTHSIHKVLPQPIGMTWFFTGQGSQYTGMGKALYAQAPLFKATIDRCENLLSVELDYPLTEILWGDNELIHQTQYTQPALFCLQYALAKLWQSMGVEPDIMLGHSVGEYALACLAGIFSLEDALQLICLRGRLIQQLPQNGSMMLVYHHEAYINELLANYSDVVIAAYNGQDLHVLSGKNDTLTEICALLTEQQIKTQLLNVSHAFHSPLMLDILDEFSAFAQSIQYHAPKIAIISTLTGQHIEQEMSSAVYWVEHIMQPVQFKAAIETLNTRSNDVVLEIGAQAHLIAMASRINGFNAPHCVASLRADQNADVALLDAIKALYLKGVEINWTSVFANAIQPLLSNLPTYPFQRQRYWLDNAPVFENSTHDLSQLDAKQLLLTLQNSQQFSPEECLLLPKILEVLKQTKTRNALSYELVWHLVEKERQPLESLAFEQWIIFADHGGIGKLLAEQLTRLGANCYMLYHGEVLHQIAHQIFELPSSLEQLESLKLPFKNAHVVHLWSCNKDVRGVQAEEVLAYIHNTCCSVLHLLQQHTPARLSLITQNADNLERDKSNTAQQGLLWGMAKGIALEYSQCFHALYDIQDAAELPLLLSELNQAKTEGLQLLRANHQYVQNIIPATNEQQNIVTIDRTGCYLITGGLGALGLQIAQWLVQQGATSIVLLARSKPTDEATVALNNLEKSGCRIQHYQLDISQQSSLAFLQQQLAHLPELKGIFHAAGTGTDLSLKKMTDAEFIEGVQAKVLGACYLHQLTLDNSLDFFCLFSSIAAVWGAKERAHYSAANHFLDSLARYRHSIGLTALSINWSAWAGQGMAQNLSDELAVNGIQPLNPQDCFSALSMALTSDNAQMMVADIAWDKLHAVFAPYAFAHLFDHVISPPSKTENLSEQTSYLHELQNLPSNQQAIALLDFISEQVAQVLELPNNKQLDEELGFFNMGMDSLMVMQLKVQLEKQLSISLPATLAFDYPNIRKLTEYIGNSFLNWKQQTTDENKESLVIDETALQQSIDDELKELEDLLGDSL